MSVIECNHVSIRYVTGDFKAIGLKEYVVRKLSHHYHVKEFWADKEITFRLEKGDMLGIIGTNGAGKSTLLKAVTGIMVPTSGTLHTEGSIAALLELASGFDDEMTVRENTYLRGALLGYTREFLDEKYEEIIAFAELEEFQDYEFKQLSSGMKSRLAFSIACLVHPNILILDEVLSVGDGAFRKKSGNKRDSKKWSNHHPCFAHVATGERSLQQGAVAGSRKTDCLHRRGGALSGCVRRISEDQKAPENKRRSGGNGVCL